MLGLGSGARRPSKGSKSISTADPPAPIADREFHSKLWAGLFALVAGGSIGSVTGWLVAETAVDPKVVAAVLPVVISAIGGLVGFQLARGEPIATMATSLFVIVFCIAIYLSSITTATARANAAATAVQTELEIRNQYRLIQLRECSRMEFFINRERKALNLPPLTTDFVCGEL